MFQNKSDWPLRGLCEERKQIVPIHVNGWKATQNVETICAEGVTVTQEAAGSSPVVPASFRRLNSTTCFFGGGFLQTFANGAADSDRLVTSTTSAIASCQNFAAALVSAGSA